MKDGTVALAVRRDGERGSHRITAGKDLSSTNATTHVAYASRSIAIHRGPLAEVQDQLDDFVNSLTARLRPEGPLEREQARHVAMSYVRLRRLLKLEELGYSQPLTIDELITLTDLRCTIDPRIAARLSKALRDYKTMVDNRRPKGPFSSSIAVLVRALESENSPGPSRELDPAELPPQPTVEGPNLSDRETNPIVDTA